MAGLTISRAQPADIGEAYAITTEYYAAVGVIEREDQEAFSLAYFGEGSGFWLARQNRAVIGCIGLRPLKRFPSSGEVKRLYIQPEWRGQGIADKLLDALHEYALARGYDWLYLDSKDDLAAALRFYEKRGYEPCARYNDNSQARVFMRKQIALL
jgi:GNAT superfamily N-acetyltransferase